ncbi:8791_t:CDS:2, partial [Entrophospora sp. SA101]
TSTEDKNNYGYLQIASPTLWNLGAFANYCSSYEQFKGDKIKKALEKIINNNYIQEDVYEKAFHLHQNFESTTNLSFSSASMTHRWGLLVRHFKVMGNWYYPSKIYVISCSTIVKMETTTDCFQQLETRYHTEQKLELIEIEKTIEFAGIERIAFMLHVTQIRNHTESIMKAHQQITDEPVVDENVLTDKTNIVVRRRKVNDVIPEKDLLIKDVLAMKK